MAITKPFETGFKITANYHKLIKVEINSSTRMVEMVVAIYVSQEAKEEGGNPLWHEYVKVPFDHLSFDPREIFYPILQDYSESYLEGGTSLLQPGVTPHQPVFEVVNTTTVPIG